MTRGSQSRRVGRFFGPEGCRRKFLRFFPGGFCDRTYISWEREYKCNAHLRWTEHLDASQMRALMNSGEYGVLASKAVAIESKTNLLFSFEKIALRDALRDPEGARTFCEGLYDFLHGPGTEDARFQRWTDAVSRLPRRQTRVLTWPLVTVFGFIAQPDRHIFFKPHVMRRAANRYGFEFPYRSKPSWDVYACLQTFAEQVRTDQRVLQPRDMIDLQSFIWVQGSDEYE